MKKSFVFAAISLMGLSAYSGPLAQYNALLSEKDHVNSSGVRLNSAAAIIRQDRANYHKFHRRDSADEWDPYFSSKKNRSVMAQMIRRAGLPYNVRNTIINCTPLVHVDIYRDRLKVRVVSDNCNDAGSTSWSNRSLSTTKHTYSYKRPSWCKNESVLNTVEQTICRDKDLSEQDLLMEALYKNYIKDYHETSSQKKWLLIRNSCGTDKTCLGKVYQQRILWLDHENDKIGIAATSKAVASIEAIAKKRVEEGLNKVITFYSSRAQEQKRVRRITPSRSSKNISINIKFCNSNYNGTTCTVYINGSPKEGIGYQYKSDYPKHYDIYYKSGGGQYYPDTSQLYTPRCRKKYNVGSIGTAMYYMIRCYEIGHY